MEQEQFTIDFPGVSVAEANRLASELGEMLRGIPGVQVNQHRNSENTQDMGASLILLLGTPAVLAVAKGVEAYLKKRHDAKITITGPQGEVRAENITGKEAIALAEVFKANGPSDTTPKQ